MRRRPERSRRRRRRGDHTSGTHDPRANLTYVAQKPCCGLASIGGAKAAVATAFSVNKELEQDGRSTLRYLCQLVSGCRRHAPYPRIDAERASFRQAAWPQTRPEDGCGEWYFGGHRGVEPAGLSSGTARASGTGMDTPVPVAGGSSLDHFGWWELRTENPTGAKKFYGLLFGWEVRDPDRSKGGYSVIELAGRPIGAITALAADAPDKKARWGNHVTVADVDAVLARARDLGGRVLVAAREVPGVGRFAVIEDPQGAALSVMSFLEQSE